MLRNRLDGLVSLHGIWVTILATASFYLLTVTTQLTGWIRLTPGFNSTFYLLGSFVGMLLAARVYLGWADKLPRLGWGEALYVTIQQLARLALVLFAAAFVVKDTDVSRVFLGTYLLLAGALLLLANRYLPRLTARLVFRSHSIPTLVVGSPAGTPGFASWLAEQSRIGGELLGYVVKAGDPAGAGPRCLGTVPELARILEAHPAAQIVVPLFYLDADDTRHVITVARAAGCRVRLVENFDEALEHPLALDHTDTGLDVIGDDEEPLENPVNRALKRLFDIAVSLPVVLLVLPPLTAVVALVQHCQAPGPVLFRQVRRGEGQKRFLIFKYRTMYVASQQPALEKVQATKNDARVFPFGRLMRKTSIDEFPQFLNVLLGDMSVAGPRPHLVQHDDEFARIVSDYRMRHFVKPGITGLAQCNGYRGEITNVGLLLKRVQKDLAYVRSWTLVLDFLIVLRTARQVLFPPRSAY